MNIVFVRITSAYGGAEVYNKYLQEMFVNSQKIQAQFITNSQRLHVELVKQHATSTFISLPFGEIGTKKELLKALLFMPIYFTVWFRTLLASSQKNKIDAICFESMAEKIFLSFLFFFSKTKVYWLEHGPVYASQRSAIILILYKFMCRFCHGIICVSEHTKSDLSNNGIPSALLKVLHIGIDIDKFASDTKEREIAKYRIFNSSHNRTYGYVGSLRFEKGIDEFLLLLSELKKIHQDFRALITGSGTQENFIRGYVRRNGLEKHVILVGEEKKNISSYYKAIDVFMFPTRCLEGLPLVLVEAGASGCMLVSANTHGGVSDILPHAEGGIHYERREKYIPKLAKNLSALSNGEVTQFGKNARSFIGKNFNKTTQARLFEQYLCQ